MINRTAIIFPLVLAGLMALLTFWIYRTVEQQGPKNNGSNRHDPDYIMKNFVTMQTDTDGKLRYMLAASKMTHYPDDDSTILELPKFTQYEVDKPYTKIKGKLANVSSNGEEIEVIDDVVVVRQATVDRGEMQVLTDKLVILPNEDLAKTDRPVVIKQAPKTVIHATGMIYDKNKKTLQLLKRVNAHYEKPKNKAK
ncbi:MAG TPA: LPS export ABC transporter periplasmic protein LptC [Methylophilaceae bacterium]|nr:LPS export ABC transporter periplasmic protein LptC [Methylophilaceae bacterium]